MKIKILIILLALAVTATAQTTKEELSDAISNIVSTQGRIETALSNEDVTASTLWGCYKLIKSDRKQLNRFRQLIIANDWLLYEKDVTDGFLTAKDLLNSNRGLLWNATITKGIKSLKMLIAAWKMIQGLP